MSNVVFILGAGASRQAGAPLMSDFLDIASDLLRAAKVPNDHEHFDRVFRAIGGLQQVHSKAQLDLLNIESIFTAFELGRVIQRLPGINVAEIPQTIASLKRLIVATLEATISFPVRGPYISAPTPYPQLAKLVRSLLTQASPRRSVSLLTFNYDICIDLAMYKENLGPDYAFDAVPSAKTPVRLLKLHGSLNWATEILGKKIRPLHMHTLLVAIQGHSVDERSSTNLVIGSEIQTYFKTLMQAKVDDEPVIVPPSWNKADYHTALSDVWSAAAKELSEAEYVYVIGYSLPETDSFFRHLYALGSVGSSTLRRFAVFRPDASGAVDRRFRDLLGPGAASRYEYHPLTFEGAVQQIGKDMRSAGDA